MSKTMRPDMNELAAAYVLGALDPDERRAFEIELATSGTLRNEVAEYREVAALLAEDITETQPDEIIWARVREKVAASKHNVTQTDSIKKRPQQLLAWGLAAAAAAVAIAFAFRANDVQQQLTMSSDALNVANAQIAAQDELLSNILSTTTEQFVLTSTGATDPGLRVFWNRQDNVMILHAFELPPPAADRVYQLWFIQDDGVVIPSLTFNTTSDGRSVLRVPGPSDPARLSQAAVSIEPIGGSQQPTGNIVLAGAVGGQ